VRKLWFQLLARSIGRKGGLACQWVVHGVDAWLAWNLVDDGLNASQKLLLLRVQAKLGCGWRLWAPIHLRLVQIHNSELLSSQVGEVLLKHLLSEGKHALGRLELSQDLRILLGVSEVEIGWSKDLLR
jgi:hypothetical protein